MPIRLALGRSPDTRGNYSSPPHDKPARIIAIFDTFLLLRTVLDGFPLLMLVLDGYNFFVVELVNPIDLIAVLGASMVFVDLRRFALPYTSIREPMYNFSSWSNKPRLISTATTANR